MRYSKVYVETVRARMRNDMESTFRQYAVQDALGGWTPELLDALVQDGMHPLEKIVAEQQDEDVILGRN